MWEIAESITKLNNGYVISNTYYYLTSYTSDPHQHCTLLLQL